MLPGHYSSASGHGEGQDSDERFRNDGNGSRDTVEDDLISDPETRDGEHDNDEEDCTHEQEVGQLRQFNLQGRS